MSAYSQPAIPLSTDRATQRWHILLCLKNRPYSTLELRELGICSPAPRIKELRDDGHNIHTSWRHEADSAGIVHRIGVYTLLPGVYRGVRL